MDKPHVAEGPKFDMNMAKDGKLSGRDKNMLNGARGGLEGMMKEVGNLKKNDAKQDKKGGGPLSKLLGRF